MYTFYYRKRRTVATILLIIISGIISIMTAQTTRLLVRADDMGASRSINIAIITAYKNGIVRSAEVMVPGPWFEEAVKLANENPGLDIGVHITLTSEWANVKWRPLTQAESITDENGYFFPFVWPNKKYPGGSIVEKEWNIADMEKEIRAQIEMALKRIPHISHLSAHMGCLGLSEATRQLYERLAKEYGLYITPEKNSKVTLFPGWSGIDTNKSQKLKSLLRHLESLQPGTYLLVEHPAFNDMETQGMGHIGYENVAEDREGVTYAFTHESVKTLIKMKNIELISYKDIMTLDYPEIRVQNRSPITSDSLYWNISPD